MIEHITLKVGFSWEFIDFLISRSAHGGYPAILMHTHDRRHTREYKRLKNALSGANWNF